MAAVNGHIKIFERCVASVADNEGFCADIFTNGTNAEIAGIFRRNLGH